MMLVWQGVGVCIGGSDTRENKRLPRVQLLIQSLRYTEITMES